MTQLFSFPQQQAFNASGDPLPGARLFFYESETSTPKSVYSDSNLNVPHTDPVIADATGVFDAIWLDTANGTYTVRLTDSANVQLWAEDDIGTTELSLATIPGLPYDLRRAGLVPNDVTARAANTAALQAALDPTVDGVRGWVIFGNSTGNDTYYFNMGCVEIRDGVVLDHQFCNIDVAGDFDAANDRKGFYTFISDVQIENGVFNVDYDGSAGSDNGMLIRIGMRDSSPFGIHAGPEDSLTEPMANNRVLNNRITTNNATHTILALGGLQNTLIQGNTFDGLGTAISAISYEFGALNNLSGAAHISTHALNFMCVDNVVTNIAATGYAIDIVGAMTAFVDGLYAKDCGGTFIGRVGEAFYYNMVGTPTEGMSHQAQYDLRGIVGINCPLGIQFQGAQAVGGYLAGVLNALADIPRWTAQTDLISFNLDGFTSTGLGNIVASGRHLRLANGISSGASSSGGIVLQDELRSFVIEGVRVVDGAGLGIRSQSSTNIWATPRLKTGSITGCFIAGNDSHGIAMENTASVLISANVIGYSAARDGLAEATQDSGVSVATSAKGVVCEGNDVATSGGAVAYALAGNGDRGCEFRNPRGLTTFSGDWKIDGVARANSTDIGNDTAAINATHKYAGKLVYDTSNTRMLMAQGPGPTDTWITVADSGAGDVVATVTPS